MGEEEVRRPVQRHRGLAGARAALHDQHPGQPGPDHLVLLGLDGLDDVAHPPGPAGGQRGQQRRLAGDVLAAAARAGRQVEHLVVDPGQLAALGPQVPPPGHPLRGHRGGEVERPGRGRPPVDQQRVLIAVLGEQPDPADVARIVRGEIEPAETESVLHRIHLGQLFGVETARRLPLGPALRGAAGLQKDRAQPVVCLLTKVIQPVVEAVQIGLFATDVVGPGDGGGA